MAEPDRRGSARDRRPSLVRVVGRLELQQAFVTLDDIVHAARRSLRAVPPDAVPDLVDAAVQKSILLKDLRTFFDRQSATFDERWVYRTNPRHPLVRRTLIDADA